MDVKFKSSKDNVVKTVKVGFSWTLFLFSGFFGVPLFLRRLDVFGGVFLSICVVRLLYAHLTGLGIVGPGALSNGLAVISILSVILWFPLALWVGAKGNELTAKNFLKRGWMFTDPQSDIVHKAKIEWGIAA